MTYTFKCKQCGKTTVVDHKINDPHPKFCSEMISRTYHGKTYSEVCGGSLVRVFDSPNVIYNTGGFYATDRRLDATPDDDV